jgi:hypothetical protein
MSRPPPKQLAPLAFKNSARIVNKRSELQQLIIDDIQQTHNYQEDFKYDVEIQERVCTHIENYLTKNLYKDIDKKEMAINILKELFNYQDDELAIVKKNIEYLYNNKIIKKNSILSKVINYGFNFFLKK